MLAQANPINFSSASGTVNNEYSNGKSVPVWLLVSMLDDGMTEEQILQQYPSLSSAEIKAAIKYAGSAAVEPSI